MVDGGMEGPWSRGGWRREWEGGPGGEPQRGGEGGEASPCPSPEFRLVGGALCEPPQQVVLLRPGLVG